MANEPKTRPAGGSASLRWPVWGGLTAVTFAVVFLAVPPLAGVPAHLIEGCAKWIALAALLVAPSPAFAARHPRVVFHSHPPAAAASTGSEPRP